MLHPEMREARLLAVVDVVAEVAPVLALGLRTAVASIDGGIVFWMDCGLDGLLDGRREREESKYLG